MARIVIKARKDKTIKLKTLVIIGGILVFLLLAAIWGMIFGKGMLARAYMEHSIQGARTTLETGISDVSRDKTYRRYLNERFNGLVEVELVSAGYDSGKIAKRLVPGFYLETGVKGKVTWDLNCWEKIGDLECLLVKIEMAHCESKIKTWREWRRKGVTSGEDQLKGGSDTLGCGDLERKPVE